MSALVGLPSPRSALAAVRPLVLAQIAAAFAAIATDMGEPFVTRFLPAEIAQLLHQHGFGELTDFGPEQARAAYFQGRTDLDIAGAQRLIAATVRPALPPHPGSTGPLA